MKILLVNVPIWHKTTFKSAYNPGLGILYIGAVLREKKHEVSILDAEAALMRPEDIISLIQKEKYDCVGLSSLSNGNDVLIDLSRSIKEKVPNVRVIVGGVGPSSFPAETYASSRCDALVIGEGELVVERALVEDGIIQGIPPEDLDSLPFPAFDLLKPRPGSKEWLKNEPTDRDWKEVAIMWSRGCPHFCDFCSKASIARGAPRRRSPEKIVEELKMLSETYGINSFFVYDDELVGMNETHNEWLERICDKIIESGLKLNLKCQGRCNTRAIDFDLFIKMKRAGFFAVMLGCESGSEKCKKYHRKGQTNDDIRNTVSALKQAGLMIYCFWMCGLVGEDDFEASKSETLLKEITPFIDWLQVTIITPLPKSDLWYKAIENGWLEDDFDITCAFEQTPHLIYTPASRRWACELRKRYLRAFILLKTMEAETE